MQHEILFTIGDNDIPVVKIGDVKYVQKPIPTAEIASKLIEIQIASCTDTQFIYYPYYENSLTLYEYLDEILDADIFERDILARKLIKQLENIHRQGLLHGDIHPGNILVISADKSIMLVDFELASFIRTTKDNTPLYIHRKWNCNNIHRELYGMASCLFLIYGIYTYEECINQLSEVFLFRSQEITIS